MIQHSREAEEAAVIHVARKMWVFRIGFSYILGVNLKMGVFGVWVAMTIDWLFRSIAFVWRYLRGKWQLQKI